MIALFAKALVLCTIALFVGCPSAKDLERQIANQASQLFEKAESLRREANDLSERQDAYTLYQECLSLVSSEKAAPPDLEAKIRRGLGLSARDLGRFDEAIRLLVESREIFEAGDNHLQLGSLLNDLGDLYVKVGDLTTARDTLERALDAAKKSENSSGQAVALNNLGVVHAMHGNIQEALSLYRQAIEISKDALDASSYAGFTYNLGVQYGHLGYREEAFDEVNRALEIWQQLSDDSGEAVALMSLSWLHMLEDNPKLALDYIDQALQIYRKLEIEVSEAMVLEERSKILLSLGRLQEAETELRNSWTKKPPNNLERAYFLAELGAILIALGRAEEASEALTTSLSLFKNLGIAHGEVSALANLARVERILSAPSSAETYLNQALDILESTRSQILPNLRNAYFSANFDLYDLYIDLLLDQKKTTLAFEISERARARGLLDRLQATTTQVRGKERPKLEQLRHRIRAMEVNRQELIYSGATLAASELERQLQRLLLEYSSLENHDEARSISTTEPIDLASLQTRVLDSESLMLAYHLGESRSSLWIIDHQSIQAFELAPKKEIELRAQRAAALLPQSHKLPQAAERALLNLSEAILAPTVEFLEGHRLLVVADGILRTIPFAALPHPQSSYHAGSPLITEHEVIHLPSASVVDLLRRRNSKSLTPPKLLAMIADPVFESDDPRLVVSLHREKHNPHLQEQLQQVKQFPRQLIGAERGRQPLTRLHYAYQEAVGILELVSDFETLDAQGFKATLDLVVGDQLKDYRILHFATHGLLNTRHPSLSAIVLSLYDTNRTRLDGFLRLHDLANLDLPADLVVLSACDTALGQNIRGEGLLGLGHGFFSAGASRLLASHWKVDDEATATMMVNFYTYLLEERLPPGVALQKAQLALQQDERWLAPYYWAGFALIGDWLPFSPPLPTHSEER